jgi:hypothetical protein
MKNTLIAIRPRFSPKTRAGRDVTGHARVLRLVCRHAVICVVLLNVATSLVDLIAADDLVEPMDIGTRRELFVDEHLIDSLRDARRQLHHPTPREIAIEHHAPWEGAGSGYHSVIRDGDLYRMYYRGTALGVENGKLKLGREVYCYAESRDGVTFTKPELGLHEYNGSKQNNIIWTGVGTHNFAPTLDTRAGCPAESRFKALGGLPSQGGLFAFQSADGIHWSLMSDKPVVTKGAFDSQNLAFWDATAGVYRAYFRTFTQGVTTGAVWKPAGYRAIRTATSRDFLKWENDADLTYEDSPVEHLYTNQIAPYFRAPHILIGFPTQQADAELFVVRRRRHPRRDSRRGRQAAARIHARRLCARLRRRAGTYRDVERRQRRWLTGRQARTVEDGPQGRRPVCIPVQRRKDHKVSRRR